MTLEHPPECPAMVQGLGCFIISPSILEAPGSHPAAPHQGHHHGFPSLCQAAPFMQMFVTICDHRTCVKTLEVFESENVTLVGPASVCRMHKIRFPLNHCSEVECGRDIVCPGTTSATKNVFTAVNGHPSVAENHWIGIFLTSIETAAVGLMTMPHHVEREDPKTMGIVTPPPSDLQQKLGCHCLKDGVVG